MNDTTHTVGFLLTHKIMDGCGSSDVLRLEIRPVKILADGELRNYVAGSFDREPLADLCLSAQCDRSGDIYGYRAEYRDVYAVDLARADEMTKTLRRISRGLDKMTAELGYTESFSAFVARVAKILKIQTYGYEASPRAREVSGNRWHWTNASGLSSHLAQLARDFQTDRAGV